jgi:hypothetical protein
VAKSWVAPLTREALRTSAEILDTPAYRSYVQVSVRQGRNLGPQTAAGHDGGKRRLYNIVVMLQEHRAIAQQVFNAVRESFPQFSAELRELTNQYVDLELTFPVQDGLVFKVTAQLQQDQLCFAVGQFFFCEWFPCTDVQVVGRFQECLTGILAGDIRLLEYARNGDTFIAKLQKETKGQWRTLAQWSKLRWPSLHRVDTRTFQNR